MTAWSPLYSTLRICFYASVRNCAVAFLLDSWDMFFRRVFVTARSHLYSTLRIDVFTRDPLQSLNIIDRRPVTWRPVPDQSVHVFEEVKIDFWPKYFITYCLFGDVRSTAEVSVGFVLFSRNQL